MFASHVTGRASVLRSLADRFPAIQVVDAPVSGGPDDIAAGRLTVLLGGLPAARARAAEAVRAYADPVIETGELGTALAVKLVNNFLFAANTQVLAEAVWLGEELGVAPGEMLSALNHMSGGSQVSHRAAAGADMAAFATRIGPFMKKDVAVCLEQAAERGVDPGLLIEVVAADGSSSSDLHPASAADDADGLLDQPGQFRLHPRHRFLDRPAELHRPLEQQAGDGGLLVAGERVEPAEFGHRRGRARPRRRGRSRGPPGCPRPCPGRRRGARRRR